MGRGWMRLPIGPGESQSTRAPLLLFWGVPAHKSRWTVRKGVLGTGHICVRTSGERPGPHVALSCASLRWRNVHSTEAPGAPAGQTHQQLCRVLGPSHEPSHLPPQEVPSVAEDRAATLAGGRQTESCAVEVCGCQDTSRTLLQGVLARSAPVSPSCGLRSSRGNKK